MKPLILLDFDGVLFDSAYEAFQVCERLASKDDLYRNGLSFEEFMRFRAHLTDAWQFCRLYHKENLLTDFSKLPDVKPGKEDWWFAERFFSARAEMIKDPNWAKLMSPFPFFHQLRPMLLKYPETFKILSTRNRQSIQRTLEFFNADGIDIYGQEDIREHGSKLDVARKNGWLSSGSFVVYIDDMSSHLEPFEKQVDLCIHAGWGYDAARTDSYTQGQSLQILTGFLKIAYD